MPPNMNFTLRLFQLLCSGPLVLKLEDECGITLRFPVPDGDDIDYLYLSHNCFEGFVFKKK